MPERAAEAMQAPEDTREELIAKAAGEWTAADGGIAPPGDLGRALGDLPDFLTAYYRLVAVEDLIAAGPTGWPRPRPGTPRSARPPAGPSGRRRPARRRRLADRGQDRHRHRHRRHAVPGRLGDDGAQPARR
jgi:hypothetical protein